MFFNPDKAKHKNDSSSKNVAGTEGNGAENIMVDTGVGNGELKIVDKEVTDTTNIPNGHTQKEGNVPYK